MDVQVRVSNIRCFLGKYCLKVVKLKDCKIKQTGSKTIQTRNERNRECLNIANLLNAKVAKIIKYQPHRGSNYLLSAKRIKTEKEKGAYLIKLFQPVQFINLNV